MDNETIGAILQLIISLISLALVVAIPILFGWLIYKAIIGIIREVKKKD